MQIMAHHGDGWHGRVRTPDGPGAGVLVTNGRDVAVTGADGGFRLPADPDARFVVVTAPRGYRAAPWYVPLADRDPAAPLEFSIAPAPERGGDAVTLLHVTDIHVCVDHADEPARRGDQLYIRKHSTGRHGPVALTRWEDLAANLEWIARREPAAIGYAITGDLANSGRRAEHEAFRRALDAAPLPAFCIPGNHDYMDERALERNYEAVLGPRYYSVDLGAVHVVAVDWWELDRYPERAPRQRAWIANDLAAVGPDVPVVILSHDQLDEAFFTELRGYNIVATFSGHRHATRVYDDGRTRHFNGPTFMFGAYDHSPRAYRVVLLDGGDVHVETKSVHDDPRLQRHGFTGWHARGVDRYDAPAVRTNGAWTQFHGDAGRRGVAAETLAPPLRPAWTAHLGDALNLGGPVVTGDAVVVGLQREDAPGGALVALDARTGEERWRLDAANSIKRTPAAADGTVVACTVSGELIAADVASGAVRWRYQLGDPSRCWIFTAPVIHDGAVFLGEAFHFAAVELDSGEPRWVRTDFGEMAEFVNMSSPAAADGRVFASFFWQQQNFAALDARTGETLWSHTEGKRRAAMGGAAAANGRVFVSRVHMRLECLEAATGELRWQTPLGAIFSQATPVVSGDTVYAVGGLGHVQALDAATGEPQWQWQAPDAALLETAPYMRATPNVTAPPVLTGEFLYVPSNCGRLTALETRAGAPVWSYEFGAPLPGAPAASGNALFVPAADGSLTALVAS